VARCAGLILAAGAGTRFGAQTKQLADLRGKPLLQHAVDAMNAALERAVVVLGHDAEAIRAAVDFGPAEVVVCEDWARGQGFSLRAGAAALAGDAGARELLARFRVRRWEAGHLASATDIDTQDELARL